MKILMISEKDAANFSLTSIANAFLNKGHHVEIFAPHRGQNALRMFNKDISIHSLDDLDEAGAMKFDCIFASAFVAHALNRRGLLGVKKYIFTYDYLIHGEIVNRVDFGFSPSINNTTSPLRNYLQCPLMGVGEPRFDALSFTDSPDSRQILFIDSGHYPFGDAGKKELSETLISMAETFPAFSFVIKPRFLPQDEIYTHRNTVHLYDVLREVAKGYLPKNLILLLEHKNMEDLINASRTIICMYTTAYITALAAKKGLIILDELSNEDNCDLRVKRLVQTRTGMQGTGALVRYDKAVNDLPDGVQNHNDHLKNEITCLDRVSEKIVDTVEDIVMNHIGKGDFPKALDYRYGDPIEYETNLSWDQIIYNRTVNSFKYFVMTKFDYYINANIDVQKLEGMIRDHLTSEKIDLQDPRIFEKRVKTIQDVFMAESEHEMMADELDQGFLLKAFYDLGMFTKITTFPNTSLRSYQYFAGRIAIEEKRLEAGIQLLESFLNQSLKQPFKKEICDDKPFHMNAFQLLGEAYGLIGDKKRSTAYFSRFIESSGNTAQKELNTKEKLYRELAYRRFYEKWQAAASQNRFAEIDKQVSSGEVMIYGAGTITESVLMNLSNLKTRCTCLVDRFNAQKNKYGIPVIRPEEIVDYPNVKTIIIAVPHLYDEIMNDLKKIRNDMTMIRVEELLDYQAF